MIMRLCIWHDIIVLSKFVVVLVFDTGCWY